MMVLKIANSPKAIGAENSSVYLKALHSAWIKLEGKKDRLASMILKAITAE